MSRTRSTSFFMTVSPTDPAAAPRRLVSDAPLAGRPQAQVRGFLAQRLYQNLRVRHLAATLIQKMWRGYEVRLWYTNLRRSLVHFQVRRAPVCGWLFGLVLMVMWCCLMGICEIFSEESSASDWASGYTGIRYQTFWINTNYW